LRTPLAELRALVDLAELEQSEGLPVAPLLQDMRGVSQRMGELLDALFRLARFERSADGARSLAPVVLEQMLDAAWQAQAARAGQRGLGLVWQAPPSAGPGVVWSQPTLLRALVDNLLGNALAHAPADSLVSVSLGSGAEPTLVLRNRCESVAEGGAALMPALPGLPALHLGQGLVIAGLYAQALGIDLETRRDEDFFEASLAWPEQLPASASDHLGPAPWAGLRRLADWLRNRRRRAPGSPLSNLNSEEMP
jgi:hypothetical protein